MALVLSLRAGQGFFVGDEEFTVVEIRNDHSFRLKRHSDGRMFSVDDKMSQELMPDVNVQSSGVVPVARVSLQAPRDIYITRSDAGRRG